LDNYRTPRLPDNDRIWLAGGLEWRLSEKHRFDFGYAYLIIDDASSNLVADNPREPDYAEKLLKGNLVGTYSGNVSILGLQYTLTF
jgi:long-chain fatty acid transport protein